MDSERDAAQMPASFQIVASEDGDDFASGYKTCKLCQYELPLDSFRKEKSGVGGRKAICRVCMAMEPKPKKERIKDLPLVDHQAALTNAYFMAIKEGII